MKSFSLNLLPSSAAESSGKEEGPLLRRVGSACRRSQSKLWQRLHAAWKRHQYRRIQTAIRTYSAEKHFQSALYHPVVGPATMRMVNRMTERNKLPFHVRHSEPLTATPRLAESEFLPIPMGDYAARVNGV